MNSNEDQYIHNNYDWLFDEESTKPLKQPRKQTEKPERPRSKPQLMNNDWGYSYNTDWGNDKHTEEYRVDPFDLKLYNQKEFLDYYGRYLEWDFQDPILIIRRKNINNMVMGYRNILPSDNINFLLGKIIETFI